MSDAPIERTVKYTTNADELADAWAFIMTKVDEVGPDPHIQIRPLHQIDDDKPMRDPDNWKRVFEVTISGMEEVKVDD
jgi:hypothetical protein